MSNKSLVIENFKVGTVNKYEAKSIPRGSASDSSNFLTKLDKIELTRGRELIGNIEDTTGRVRGLKVVGGSTGTEYIFKITDDGELQYWKESADTWEDVLTGLTNEDHAMSNYHSLAGGQMFVTSDTDGYYKVIVDNKTAIDLNYATKQPYKGKINIKRGRSFMWTKDAPTTLYGSYIDTQVVTEQYTAVASEVVGALGSITYTGTLAFKAGGSRRNCFSLSFTESGGEVFNDNRDGTLTGDAGGTGTINYSTGAYSITFNAITTGAVTADYTWEDSALKGIVDFSKSATRVAGEGFLLQQAEGGDAIMNVMEYNEDIYSLKDKRTYKLSLSADDLTINNKVFRESAGVPNWQMAVETEEGIYFMDDSTDSEPKLRVMTIGTDNDVVKPISLTESFDFSDYKFDMGCMVVWGDYVAFTGRKGAKNDTLFLFNTIFRSIDTFAWGYSYLDVYNGALIGGEINSNNVYTIFSGLDDDGFTYPATWEGNNDELGLGSLKKVKRLRLQGEIGVNQKIYVYASYDGDGFQPVIDTKHPDGAISGDASYVDTGTSVSIGATTIGRFEVGGGGSGITAYNYNTEFRINTPKFRRVKLKFEIKESFVEDGESQDLVGYASVSKIEFFAINQKRYKQSSKYR